MSTEAVAVAADKIVHRFQIPGAGYSAASYLAKGSVVIYRELHASARTGKIGL